MTRLTRFLCVLFVIAMWSGCATNRATLRTEDRALELVGPHRLVGPDGRFVDVTIYRVVSLEGE